MELLHSNYCLNTIILVIIFIGIKYYINRKYNYWKNQGITQLKPRFPFGNTKGLILKTEYVGHTVLRIYKYLKEQNVKFGGYYQGLTPYFLPMDPDLIKQIVIKDFQHFTDKGLFSNEKTEPLTGHLVALSGSKWKSMRSNLTPTFTSSKMKMMFQTLVATSHGLHDLVEESIRKGEPLDIKDILSRFGTDVIGNCAFGIECDSIKKPDNDFRKYGEMVLKPQGWNLFKFAVATVFPSFFKTFGLHLFDKGISNFFMGVVKDTVRYREENNVSRKDFLQILLQLKKKNDANSNDNQENKGCLTVEEIAAQCFVFFMAGFETSSTTMSWCLYELTQNPDVQEKLREEILGVLKKNNGELVYEDIMGMEYLDLVINETLRFHPPVSTLVRKCTQDYKIPNTRHVLKKGQMIRFSLLGLHYDPDYYSDPEKFIPERFTEEEKNKRPLCTFMPFGEGPRQCIGLRFGLMQAKVGLTVLLKNFRFSLNKTTRLPITVEPSQMIQTVVGGIWLDGHKVVS